MYKSLADSTLLRMPKKEIIELLRTAEHNAKVSQEWVAQQAKNLKDWEPVVRCKDCVHWDDDPDTYGADSGTKGKCMKSFETMCENDFCSYGERKDEANES